MRGRIRVTRGLVLAARLYKEADRLSVIYTEEFGKIRVRFIGVERPRGKLKALAETMVWGEYRLYMRDGAEFGTGAGGQVVCSFAGLRSTFESTLRGLEMLELLDQLTPFWKPNPRKLELATRFLSALDADPTGAPWLGSAYTLRLLRTAGFGLAEREVSTGKRALWRMLHDAPLDKIAALADAPDDRRRLETFLRQTVEQVSERQLKSAVVREQLAGETILR